MLTNVSGSSSQNLSTTTPLESAASSSSVSLLAQQCLSQNVIAVRCFSETTMIVSEDADKLVESILHLKTTPLLDEGVRPNISLAKILKLAPSETVILDEICKKWHLSTFITLQSLFGVSIYDSIKNLESEIGRRASDEILCTFSTYFFGSYLRQVRDQLPLVSEDHKFRGIYTPTTTTIIQELTEIPTKISTQIISQKPSFVNGNGKGSRESQFECRLKGMQEKKREKIVGPIRDMINLYIKIYKNDKKDFVLFDNHVGCFKVAVVYNSTIESFEVNIKHLSLYADFLNSMILYSNKSGLSGISFPFFAELRNQLRLTKKDELIKGLKRIEIALNTCFNKIAIKRVKNEDLVEGGAGRFTHAQWLQKNGIEGCRVKSQQEFFEQLVSHAAFFGYMDIFANNFQKILEETIIKPTFTEFSSIIANADRLNLNSAFCPQTPPNHILSTKDSVVRNFEHIFCQNIESIEFLFERLLVDGNFIALQKINTKKNLQLSINSRLDWNQKLGDLSYTNPLIEQVKTELTKAIPGLNAAIKELLTPFQGLPQDQKQALVDDIQNMCVQQSLFLVRMVMIAEDISAILQGTFSYHPKYIPDELVDLLCPDYLEEFLTLPSSLENEAVEVDQSLEDQQESSSEPSITEPVKLTELVSQNGEGKKEKELPQKTLIRAVKTNLRNDVKAERAKKKLDPVELKRVLREGRSRKISALLMRHGFAVKRQSGHIILSNKEGQIVPIPRARQQDYGTSLSIGRMATEGKGD